MPKTKTSPIPQPSGGNAEPPASRPHVPGYGIPKSPKGMLSWRFVNEQMAKARHYWICTTRPEGRSHAVPVWGVWVAETFYHGGGPDTRKARNLARNPQAAVHLGSGEDVVIIEGVMELIAKENADPALAERISGAYEAKYKMRHPPPFWALRPRVVFAWAGEDIKTATRWRFAEKK